jgi:hypothetical protein
MKKKNLLVTLAVTILLSASAAAQTVPSYVPTNGLVGWWPFSGNPNDESGNGFNGTNLNATLTSDRNGNSNTSYDFSFTNAGWGSQNNAIYIQYSPEFNSQNITVSTWIFPRSYYWIGNSNDPNSTIIERFQYGYSNPNGQSWILGFNNLGVYATILQGATDNNQNYETAIYNTPLSLNVWHNISFSYDGLSLKLYINANLVSTVNTSIPINITSNSGIAVGESHAANGYWRYTDGKIDDIGIWNRALTPQEITTLYQGCQNPTTATITSNGNTTFCQGGSVNLDANMGTNLTYQWYRNGTLIPNETNASYTANQAGSYTVNINNGECSAVSNAIVVTVNPSPTVNFNALTAIVSRNANAINLSGTPNGGTFSGAGVSGSQFIPFNAGLGQKTLTYSYTDNNNCTNTATQSVIVYDTVACSVYDTTFVTETIYDTLHVTVQDTIYTTVTDTVYNYITVTDTLLINTTLGLQPNQVMNTIKVYPNPANTEITIHYGNFGLMNGYLVKISNNVGQIVYSANIAQQSVTLNLADWTGDGLYHLEIYDTNNNLIENRKIVLQ